MDKYRDISLRMNKVRSSYDNATAHIEIQEKKEENIKRVKERFTRQKDYAIMDSIKIRDIAEHIYPSIADRVNKTKEEFMADFPALQ
jgi:hypothetical protein